MLQFADPPSSPRDLRVVGFDIDYVSLSWKEPVSDGGSEVTAYVVERRDVNLNLWTSVAKTG